MEASSSYLAGKFQFSIDVVVGDNFGLNMLIIFYIVVKSPKDMIQLNKVMVN